MKGLAKCSQASGTVTDEDDDMVEALKVIGKVLVERGATMPKDGEVVYAASERLYELSAMKKAADAWGCAGEFIDALVGAFAARYPELSPHRDELNERLCKLVAAIVTASKHRVAITAELIQRTMVEMEKR